MRRYIEWKTKREDGSFYEVRVSYFGGKYKFQFRENKADLWDYNRVPCREDLETLVSAIERRYQRQQVGPQEVKQAKRLLG